MPRYVRQYDKFSCGPIAIINAIKWGGGHATLRQDRKRLMEKCNCSMEDGSHFRYFNRALREECAKLSVEVKCYFRVNIGGIERHLRSGGAIIITYCWFEHESLKWEGHYFLLTAASKSGKSFLGINPECGQTFSWCRRQKIIDHLNHKYKKNTEYSPAVWFLRKIS